MCDYMPVKVILKILSKLPLKSVVKCRSVCKTWNTLISDPSFISAHLQASLSNNTPFLLIGCEKQGRETLSLHHDNDGFDKFKELPFPPFGNVGDFPLANICEVDYFNVGFGYDWRTNDYKLLILGVDKGNSWIQPDLFSLNENCWKRVTAIPPNYAFGPQSSLPFVSGAVYWLGYQERNNGVHIHVILGFDLSAEVFLEINLPEDFTGFSPLDLSIMKYGESSFVSVDPIIVEFQELWVLEKKNGEVLLRVCYVKMASLDLNSQQMGASLYLNCELMEFHGVEVGSCLLSLSSYVESLVLLDKAGDVHNDSDVNHPLFSSDSDESIGGD
ncbi:hypothetical protein V6N11_030719 [Hibiscus sabdariffa]|uniref:F-box domain-containing protein n=2 Tax=Hibiscus sabdariffa TaxID=183260 RepID=A0ABR2BBC5_9ROSI